MDFLKLVLLSALCLCTAGANQNSVDILNSVKIDHLANSSSKTVLIKDAPKPENVKEKAKEVVPQQVPKALKVKDSPNSVLTNKQKSPDEAQHYPWRWGTTVDYTQFPEEYVTYTTNGYDEYCQIHNMRTTDSSISFDWSSHCRAHNIRLQSDRSWCGNHKQVCYNIRVDRYPGYYDRTVTIDGLCSGFMYDVALSTDYGTTRRSVRTTAAGASKPNATAISDSEVFMKWSGGECATELTVVCEDLSGFGHRREMKVHVGSPNDNQMVVSYLRTGTTYHCYVRTCRSRYECYNSDSQIVTTKLQEVAGVPPLKVTVVSPHDLDVYFGTPRWVGKFPINHYVINLMGDDDNSTSNATIIQSKIEQNAGKSVKFSDLEPGTEYRVECYAVVLTEQHFFKGHIGSFNVETYPSAEVSKDRYQDLHRRYKRRFDQLWDEFRSEVVKSH